MGRKKLNESEKIAVRKHRALKRIIIIGIFVLYIMAVFVDLPVAEHLQEEYLAEFAEVKAFFQHYEGNLSRGYEVYPPLFEKKVAEDEPVEEVEEEEEVPVYIQLNDKGRFGANARQEPSLNGEIVGGVNGESEILYQYQWESDDEERYWIKICVLGEEVEGWLSGTLIDDAQLEMLVSKPET